MHPFYCCLCRQLDEMLTSRGMFVLYDCPSEFRLFFDRRLKKLLPAFERDLGDRVMDDVVVAAAACCLEVAR